MTIFEEFPAPAGARFAFLDFRYMLAIVDKLSRMINPFIIDLLKLTPFMQNLKLAIIDKLGFELNLTVFIIKIHFQDLKTDPIVRLLHAKIIGHRLGMPGFTKVWDFGDLLGPK